MTKQSPALVWFRQDLRLADHAALTAAVASGRPVLPLYILDDASPGEWALGGASRWWLHGSLASLAAGLRERGAPLLLLRGEAATLIPRLMDETGAAELHAGRMHEPWAREVEAKLAATLGDAAASAPHRHPVRPRRHPHQVGRRVRRLFAVRARLPRPRAARATRCRRRPGSAAPPARLPTGSRTGTCCRATPIGPAACARPGRSARRRPRARLSEFLDAAIGAYKTGRNLPGQDGTSRLSAHLHWGELSPRQVWAGAGALPPGDGQDTFLGEVLWREFSAYLLWHNPHLPDSPLRPAFDRLPFRDDPAEASAWQRGRTGVPIIDAGMRQLWHIGWMHNRVRMIAASFLVKQLLIDWRDGERWFWDTLVDADLASNAASWQWVAGCGIDSQPFFRIFNPVTQGATWDKAGDYVRRWVPELAALPDRWLHAPWTAPGEVVAHRRGRAGPDLSAADDRPCREPPPRARHLPRHRPARGRVIPHGAALRIVGDVHGDLRAFSAATNTDRFVVQLGDLSDHGPDSAGVLRRMFELLDAGRGLFILGNHDRKLGRALAGYGVRMDAALETTLTQLDPALRDRALQEISRAPAWIVGAGMAFVHGGFHPAMLSEPPPPPLGRVDPLLSRALFGQTTGRMQPDGYPERVLRWVDRIPAGITVYCGHDQRSTDGRPYVRAGAEGGTAVFLDTGAGKGGHLSWIDLPAGNPDA